MIIYVVKPRAIEQFNEYLKRLEDEGLAFDTTDRDTHK